MIDDRNQVTNFKRHHIREINKAVRELSDDQKQKLLESIQCRSGTCILMGQQYDEETRKYIESLLKGERPKNGLS